MATTVPSAVLEVAAGGSGKIPSILQDVVKPTGHRTDVPT
jgi:hypothetical protein